MKFSYILTALLVTLSFSTSNAKVTTVNSAPAKFYVCNQLVYSYCSQTEIWGQGFGQIVFKNGTSYDVRPWGTNPTQAAIITGQVQALQTIESHTHSQAKFFFTRPVVVSGFFGLDPILKKKTIFYLLKMEQ